MSKVKVKVSELKGAALDWVVAQCEIDQGTLSLSKDDNVPMLQFGDKPACYKTYRPPIFQPGAYIACGSYWPSTDWGVGGPIIEREKISVCAGMQSWFATDELYARENSFGERGPTPLIAAMRCYVTSKVGDEIEIPEELL